MPPIFPQSRPRSSPQPWPQYAEAARLWTRLRAAKRSILLLDYDGTLAPFTVDRLRAYPYPGVEDRLARLAHLPRVRLVLVSGRPARELEGLLSSLGTGLNQGKTRIEIWGSHGRERLKADGSYFLRPLLAEERATMTGIRREIERLGYAQAVEMKSASLAVHWRGSEPAVESRLRSAMESLGDQHAESGLELHAFDGGIELRPKGYSKGTAVERILAEEAEGLPTAYLGDDLTDEDAFSALGSRGLSILVRAEPRHTIANFWLKPPDELLKFLDDWIRASTREESQ